MMNSLHRYRARTIAMLLCIIVAVLPGLRDTAQAASFQEPGKQTGTISAHGLVRFRPQWSETPQLIEPRAYLIILDATTSMSWNFAGQGTKDGRDVQCGPASDPSIQRQYCGAGAPWRRPQERRIYAAKQALRLLIDQLDRNDTMRLIAFSTHGISTSERWTSNKAALRRSLLELGAYKNDPYRTAGEAPSASALYKARQLLAQVPQTAPNGLGYGQPIVLFLTDSVANRFLKPNGGWENRPQDSCPHVPFADDMASCQIGYTSGNPSLAKPITAMGLQADQLKPGATIYVMALAGVDETGLKDVASAPYHPFFSSAVGPDDLSALVNEIGAGRIHSSGPCIPHGGTRWIDHIDAQHIPDPNGLIGISDTVFGFVYLYDAQGSFLKRAPIMHDAQTGKLGYSFGNLASGTYQMRGFVAYKGDDGVTRIYMAIFNPATYQYDASLAFILMPSAGLGDLVELPRLYLALAGSVCPLP